MKCIRTKIVFAFLCSFAFTHVFGVTERASFDQLLKKAGEQFSLQKRKNEVLVANGLGHLANYVFTFGPVGDEPQEYVTYKIFDPSEAVDYVSGVELLSNEEKTNLNQKLIDINNGASGSCLEEVKMYAIVIDAVFLATEFKGGDALATFSQSNPSTTTGVETIPLNLSSSGTQTSNSNNVLFSIEVNPFLPQLELIIAELVNKIKESDYTDVAIAVAGRFFTRYDNTQPFLVEQFISCDVFGNKLSNETVKTSIFNDFIQYQLQFNDLYIPNESVYKSAAFGIDALKSIVIKNQGGVENLCTCLSPNDLAYNLKTVKEAEYRAMSMDTRMCIIRKLCSEALTAETWYWNLLNAGSPLALQNPKITIGPFQDEEGAVIKIMKTLPADSHVDFLNRLKEQLTVGSESKTILNWLLSKMNESNYDEMIRLLLIMSKTYFNRPDVPFTATQIINYANEESNACNKSGQHIFSSIDVLNNGNINYAYKVVERCMSGEVEHAGTRNENVFESTEYSGSLDPYSPILLINNSSLPLVGEALASTGQGPEAIVPAFFLKYIADKEFESTVQKYIQAAAIIVDVATLVTGPGLMIKAFKASKYLAGVYEASQLIGSGTNLVLNVTGVSPEMQDLLNKYNLFIGAWGLSRIPALGATWNKVTDAIKDGDVITVVSKTDADDFIKKYNELNVPSSTLSTTPKSQLAKMEDYFKSKGLATVNNSVQESFSNLITVAWKNNINGYLSNTDALTFWNNTTKKFNHYIDGDFYLKFDSETGDLLFANYMTNEILGFYEGLANVGTINQKGLQSISAKLKIYHGSNGAPSYINTNVSSGAKIISNPNKTATIVGNFQRYPYNLNAMSGDMKNVVDEICGNLKTQQFGPKKGGFNILNVADEIVNDWSKFWEDFNKPWLELAITRGDDIWSASDPMDKSILFKDITNVPDITNSSEIYLYFQNPAKFADLTGFGKEIKTLIDNGYSFNSSTKMFVK